MGILLVLLENEVTFSFNDVPYNHTFSTAINPIRDPIGSLNGKIVGNSQTNTDNDDLNRFDKSKLEEIENKFITLAMSWALVEPPNVLHHVSGRAELDAFAIAKNLDVGNLHQMHAWKVSGESRPGHMRRLSVRKDRQQRKCYGMQIMPSRSGLECIITGHWMYPV